MKETPVYNLTRTSDERRVRTEQIEALQAALRVLGESMDELGSAARRGLVAELVRPVIERYVGPPVPAAQEATRALDLRERVATGAAVIAESWRAERQRECQALVPPECKFWVIIGAKITRSNGIEVGLLDMSDWAIAQRGSGERSP